MSGTFTALSFCIFFAVAFASNDLAGTMVGARLRCQGYLCPQWALDIGRYDPIRKVNTEFQFILQELLPLAPTFQRSMNLVTSYDNTNRYLTVAACDYPVQGVDSLWVSVINADVTSASTVYANVMIPHPDASTNNPGTIRLVKLNAIQGGIVTALFSDGSVYELNVKEQKYSKLGALYSSDVDGTAKYFMTNAHALDGTILKSFVMDGRSQTFLIETDLSASPIKVSDPLKVVPIPGQLGTETPNDAFMFTVPGQKPQLLLINHGNFDSFSFIDETTGVSTSLIANLYDATNEPGTYLACYSSTKDCDMWQTAMHDTAANKIYYQSHFGETQELGIFYFEFVSNIAGTYYPISNESIGPMQFGYSGYQYVPFTN